MPDETLTTLEPATGLLGRAATAIAALDEAAVQAALLTRSPIAPAPRPTTPEAGASAVRRRVNAAIEAIAEMPVPDRTESALRLLDRASAR